MQRLGHVLHVSSSRNLILKAEGIPKVGEKVVDADLKSVGTVFDVFGPVSSPYAAVKPTISEAQHLIGNTLYAIPNRGRKEKRKHGR